MDCFIDYETIAFIRLLQTTDWQHVLVFRLSALITIALCGSLLVSGFCALQSRISDCSEIQAIVMVNKAFAAVHQSIHWIEDVDSIMIIADGDSGGIQPPLSCGYCQPHAPFSISIDSAYQPGWCLQSTHGFLDLNPHSSC